MKRSLVLGAAAAVSVFVAQQAAIPGAVIAIANSLPWDQIGKTLSGSIVDGVASDLFKGALSSVGDWIGQKVLDRRTRAQESAPASLGVEELVERLAESLRELATEMEVAIADPFLALRRAERTAADPRALEAYGRVVEDFGAAAAFMGLTHREAVAQALYLVELAIRDAEVARAAIALSTLPTSPEVRLSSLEAFRIQMGRQTAAEAYYTSAFQALTAAGSSTLGVAHELAPSRIAAAREWSTIDQKARSLLDRLAIDSPLRITCNQLLDRAVRDAENGIGISPIISAIAAAERVGKAARAGVVSSVDLPAALRAQVDRDSSGLPGVRLEALTPELKLAVLGIDPVFADRYRAELRQLETGLAANRRQEEAHFGLGPDKMAMEMPVTARDLQVTLEAAGWIQDEALRRMQANAWPDKDDSVYWSAYVDHRMAAERYEDLVRLRSAYRSFEPSAELKARIDQWNHAVADREPSEHEVPLVAERRVSPLPLDANRAQRIAYDDLLRKLSNDFEQHQMRELKLGLSRGPSANQLVVRVLDSRYGPAATVGDLRERIRLADRCVAFHREAGREEIDVGPLRVSGPATGRLRSEAALANFGFDREQRRLERAIGRELQATLGEQLREREAGALSADIARYLRESGADLSQGNYLGHLRAAAPAAQQSRQAEVLARLSQVGRPGVGRGIEQGL